MDDPADDGPLVPIGHLMVEAHLASLRAALREVAQSLGEYRACVTCGAMIASFIGRRNKKAMVYTVHTGNPHHLDCTPLAMHRAKKHNEHTVAAHATLKQNGLLVDLVAPAGERRHPDHEEIERMFQEAESDD